MEVKIFPYTKVDGMRTKRDSEIMALFDQMVLDGTASIVFFAGHIKTREDFLKYMKDPGVHLYILAVGDETVGVTWLDNIVDKSALNHFCGFSNYWGVEGSEAIGKAALGKLINMRDETGYIFDVFTGCIPAWNTRAIEYARACGGVSLGVIPCGIWDSAKGQSVDAVVIYYTRESV